MECADGAERAVCNDLERSVSYSFPTLLDETDMPLPRLLLGLEVTDEFVKRLQTAVAIHYYKLKVSFLVSLSLMQRYYDQSGQ